MVAWNAQTLWWIADSAHQAQKGSDFHVSFEQSELSHSFQVLFAGPHTLSGDMTNQIVDLIPEEFSLSGS